MATSSLILDISGDYERTKAVVIAAMLFPRQADFRQAYCLRNEWDARVGNGTEFTLTSDELQALLDLPSRKELKLGAEIGTKQGAVAGDLLCKIYEQWRYAAPEPSMRSALKGYRSWAPGKKYGDGTPLKYSDMQLRHYFAEAAPAAHLWAAFRWQLHMNGGKRNRTAFTSDGLPALLGVARELQEFAATFVPKRVNPAKPVVERHDMLQIPAHVVRITPKLPDRSKLVWSS